MGCRRGSQGADVGSKVRCVDSTNISPPTTNVSKDPDDSMLPKIFHGGRSKVQALTAQHISETNVHGEGFLASNCRNLCQHSRDNCQHSRDGTKQESEVYHMHRWHHLAFFVNFHSKVQCGDGKQCLFTFECCMEVFCVWSCQCLQSVLGC